MTYPSTPYITLVGHLGADPLTCFERGLTETRQGYDVMARQECSCVVKHPDWQFQTGRLVDATVSTGQPLPTRWQRLFAFKDRLASYRKGDRIEVLGHFRRRIGEPTSIVEFVVLEARLLHGGRELEAVGGATAHLAFAPHVEGARAAHQAQVGAEVAALGVERVRAAPQAQEHVLDDVLGHRRVVDDPERGGVHGAVVFGERAPKGLGVTQISSHNQRYTPC